MRYCIQTETIDLLLVVFDLDNFKQINIKYGHSAGDLALKKTCGQAKKCIRSEDVIARFGGDEFVLLLSGMNQQDALRIVERVRIAIKLIKIGGDYLSSSFGIVDLQGKENFNALFERADKALYASKESGGNHISLAT